jgi:predicted ATPase
MPPNTVKPINTTKALKAFKDINFNYVAGLSDIYTKLEYDVPEINADIKEKFNDSLHLLKSHASKKSMLVLPMVGSAGSGKTHLLNYFYNHARDNNGFFMATEFFDANSILKDINVSAANSLLKSDLHEPGQLIELIKNIIIESNINFVKDIHNLKDHIKKLSLIDRENLIKNVSQELYSKYPSEISDYSNILRAIFFLGSANAEESIKAKTWLQSDNTKGLEPEKINFTISQETP